MEWYEYPFIIGIGFLAAFLNTVGGGGSLFTVPILTFLGMPITTANATARVAILAQNVSAVSGFASKKVELPLRYSLWLCGVSLIGGFIGSRVAAHVSDELFRQLFVGVMLFSTALVIINPFRSNSRPERMQGWQQAVGVFLFFFIGIYGGFVQAGIGFLVIGALSLVHNFPLIKINYIKVFVAIVYTGVSVAVFAWEGKIDWFTGMILAIGHGLGGWYASRWSVTASEVWIKRIMIGSVLLMAVKLWFFE
jgi:uncharacterized membrane protein YfcA